LSQKISVIDETGITIEEFLGLIVQLVQHLVDMVFMFADSTLQENTAANP
jgi:hypothetical protein